MRISASARIIGLVKLFQVHAIGKTDEEIMQAQINRESYSVLENAVMQWGSNKLGTEIIELARIDGLQIARRVPAREAEEILWRLQHPKI